MGGIIIITFYYIFTMRDDGSRAREQQLFEIEAHIHGLQSNQNFPMGRPGDGSVPFDKNALDIFQLVLVILVFRNPCCSF